METYRQLGLEPGRRWPGRHPDGRRPGRPAD
jgi:hypothetical protein